jgi:hypothetical protein
MVPMIRKITHYLRNFLLGVFRDTKHQYQDSILFDFKTNTFFKTPRYLFILFDAIKTQVVYPITFRKRFVSVLSYLEWHKNVKLSFLPFIKTKFLLTDYPRKRKQYNKTIYLHYDYSQRLRLDEGHFALPFIMHPQIYCQYQDHLRLPFFRNNQRKIRLAFAGNWDTGYNHPIITEELGILSRYQILDFLINSGLCQLINHMAQLEEIQSGPYQEKFLVVDRKVRIDQSKWMTFISSVDFFLCPPGVLFPLAHNSVEALAVGTIPILNYPDWFIPKLDSGINCLSFQTIDELTQIIGEVMEMKESPILTLRANVTDYYKKFLDQATFANKMIHFPSNEVHLHMLEEQEGYLRKAIG